MMLKRLSSVHLELTVLRKRLKMIAVVVPIDLVLSKQHGRCFLNAFEEIERRVIKMLDEELSYEDFDLALWAYEWTNGSLFKYLVPFDSNLSSPVPIEDLPDLNYTDEEGGVGNADHAAGLFSSSACLRPNQRSKRIDCTVGFYAQSSYPLRKNRGTTALDTQSI